MSGMFDDLIPGAPPGEVTVTFDQNVAPGAQQQDPFADLVPAQPRRRSLLPQESATDAALRAPGRAGRALIQGPAGVFDMVNNAGAAVLNAPFVAWDLARGNAPGTSEPFQYGTIGRQARRVADAAGLPDYDPSLAGQIGGALAEGGAGGGPTQILGRLAARSLTGAPQTVARAFGDAPGVDFAAGAIGQASGEGVQQAGGGEAASMGANFGASALSAVVMSTIIAAAARRRGVPAATVDPASLTPDELALAVGDPDVVAAYRQAGLSDEDIRGAMQAFTLADRQRQRVAPGVVDAAPGAPPVPSAMTPRLQQDFAERSAPIEIGPVPTLDGSRGRLIPREPGDVAPDTLPRQTFRAEPPLPTPEPGRALVPLEPQPSRMTPGEINVAREQNARGDRYVEPGPTRYGPEGGGAFRLTPEEGAVVPVDPQPTPRATSTEIARSNRAGEASQPQARGRTAEDEAQLARTEAQIIRLRRQEASPRRDAQLARLEEYAAGIRERINANPPGKVIVPGPRDSAPPPPGAPPAPPTPPPPPPTPRPAPGAATARPAQGATPIAAPRPEGETRPAWQIRRDEIRELEAAGVDPAEARKLSMAERAQRVAEVRAARPPEAALAPEAAPPARPAPPEPPPEVRTVRTPEAAPRAGGADQAPEAPPPAPRSDMAVRADQAAASVRDLEGKVAALRAAVAQGYDPTVRGVRITGPDVPPEVQATAARYPNIGKARQALKVTEQQLEAARGREKIARAEAERVAGGEEPRLPASYGDARANATATRTAPAAPMSLARYIVSRGGMRDTNGELRRAGLDRIPGLINNRKSTTLAPGQRPGLALDEADVIAREGGYRLEAAGRGESEADTLSPQDALIRALQEEQSGRPVYPEGEGQRYAAEQDAWFRDQDMIRELGERYGLTGEEFRAIRRGDLEAYIASRTSPENDATVIREIEGELSDATRAARDDAELAWLNDTLNDVDAAVARGVDFDGEAGWRADEADATAASREAEGGAGRPEADGAGSREDRARAPADGNANDRAGGAVPPRGGDARGEGAGGAAGRSAQQSDGGQLVLPGAERSDRQAIQARSEAPNRGSVPQKGVEDFALFDPEARKQTSLDVAPPKPKSSGQKSAWEEVGFGGALDAKKGAALADEFDALAAREADPNGRAAKDIRATANRIRALIEEQAENVAALRERADNSLGGPFFRLGKTDWANPGGPSFPGWKPRPDIAAMLDRANAWFDEADALPFKAAAKAAEGGDVSLRDQLYSGTAIFDPKVWRWMFGPAAKYAQPFRDGIRGFVEAHSNTRAPRTPEKGTERPGAARRFAAQAQALANAAVGGADAEMRAFADILSADGKSTMNGFLDRFFARSGQARGAGRTYDEGVSSETTRRLNQLGTALGDLIADPAKMLQVVRQVRSGSFGQGEIGNAARALSAWLKDMRDYQVKAGVEMGEIRRGYFPRVTDVEAVWRDREGFQRAAERAYRDSGVEAAEAKRMAQAWLDQVLTGGNARANALPLPFEGITANHTKGRELTGPNVDKILEPYLVSDPRQALVTYAVSAARRAEFTRAVGGAEQAEWAKVRDMLAREGRGEDIAKVQDYLAAVTGTNAASRGTGVHVTSWIRTATALGTLEKATLASIPEAVMPAVRSGNAVDAWTALSGTVRDLFGAAKGDAKRLRELGEDTGAIAGAHASALNAARWVGGDVSSKAQSYVLDRFFRRTGLEQWTRATRVGAIRVAEVFLNRIAKDAGADSMWGRKARFSMMELGIPKDKIAAFADYVQRSGAMTADTLRNAKGKDAEMAEMYRTAMLRFVDQSIMRPSAAIKPKWASHPLGAVAFQLNSYAWAFHENVLMRPLRIIGPHSVPIPGTNRRIPLFPGREENLGELTKMDRAVFAAMIGGMTSFMLPIGFAMVDLRDQLFGDPQKVEARKRRSANKEPWDILNNEEMALALSRSGVMGRMDPALNILTGVKYGKDVATSAFGPGLGQAAGAIQTLIEAQTRNSPRTNNAERKVARAVYDVGIEPAGNYLLSMLPLPVGAIATQALGHGSTKEAFVSSWAGPEQNRRRVRE